jgi:hypothetical protein
MSAFAKIIAEARTVLSEGPMQSAITKMAKASSEKAYQTRWRKHLSNATDRGNTAKRFNKAQRRLGKAMIHSPEEAYNPDETTPGEAAVASTVGKMAGAELGPAGSYVGGKLAPKAVGAWKKYTPLGMAYTKVRGMLDK